MPCDNYENTCTGCLYVGDCQGCDTCEGCNACQGCNAGCQITCNSCQPTCNVCQSCNSCQTECESSRQTPLTSNFFTFPNIDYTRYSFIKYDNHFKSIFDKVEEIKNKYINYKGTKPFASWNRPSVSPSITTIKEQYLNDIISNTTNLNDTVKSTTMVQLWENIKNYSYNTNLCAIKCNSGACQSCNTGCQGSCNSCQGCDSGCQSNCTRCQVSCTGSSYNS